ncbi:MAG: transposase [Phycisphaerae bacterium]|nr:transposase [Phycisphaerae bacterium]
MPGYRRNYEGRLFFFTIVTKDRRDIFTDDSVSSALGQIIRQTCNERPWVTDAMVLLPNHLHAIWRMPENDRDYSTRISIIKKRFTQWYLATGRKEAKVSPGQHRHRRRGVWQERFWEHTIRNARDYHMHLDYIHINPVKHGYAAKPIDWPWSSFHRYVKNECYERDWCGRVDLPGQVEYYWPEE